MGSVSGFGRSNDENNHSDSEQGKSIEERLTALEDLIAGFRSEVQTCRLVVVDVDDKARVVAETIDGVTELRLDLPGFSSGKGTSLLLFAAEGRASTGYAAAIGVQIWVEGNERAGCSMWQKPTGDWFTDISGST